MTMTAIMFAGDDEDIIESSVRHNLHHVDALFVVGVDSRDGTCQIVRRMADEGLPVAYEAAPADTTRRAFAFGAMQRLAAQDAVDRLILLGADTFIEAPAGALHDAVLRAPEAIHCLPRRVRVPTEDDDWREPDPYRRLSHARLVEIDPRFVAVVPRRLFGQVSLAGDCLFAEEDLVDAVPVEDASAVQLPVRNAYQFSSLVAARVQELTIEGGAGLPDRRERVRYWLRMGELVRGRSLLSPFALREAASSYEVTDPVPLAEDPPRPFEDHALCYIPDSATALDKMNTLIANIQREPAAASG